MLLRTHFDPGLHRRNRDPKIPYSRQTVRSAPKGEVPIDFACFTMSQCVQHGDGFQPAKAFFEDLALALTLRTVGMSGRAPINYAATTSAVILRHVGHDMQFLPLRQKPESVNCLIAAHHEPPVTRYTLQRAFCCPIRPVFPRESSPWDFPDLPANAVKSPAWAENCQRSSKFSRGAPLGVKCTWKMRIICEPAVNLPSCVHGVIVQNEANIQLGKHTGIQGLYNMSEVR